MIHRMIIWDKRKKILDQSWFAELDLLKKLSDEIETGILHRPGIRIIINGERYSWKTPHKITVRRKRKTVFETIIFDDVDEFLQFVAQTKSRSGDTILINDKPVSVQQSLW